MSAQIGWGIVRHLVTLFAGMLATYGVIQSSGEADAASAIMAVLTILWSVWEKRAALKAQIVAHQAGFQAGLSQAAPSANQQTGTA